MALLSSTRVVIDGNTLKTYKTFTLQQDLGEHHNLELLCYAHNLEQASGSASFDELLGTIITIEILPLVSLSYYKALRFKGVITGIVQKQGTYSGEGDVVLLQAKSPTILAEDGPNFTSYSDKSIVDIITHNFKDYDTSKLKVNTSNSKLQDPLLYTVQNNESGFEFAKNLASRNGEWLYYNGVELLLGLDTSGENVELKLGRDLKEFSTSMVPKAQKFNYLTNDYLTDKLEQKDTGAISAVNGVGKVNTKSEELYTKETQVWLSLIDDSGAKSKLDRVVEVQTKANQGNQLTMSGVSDNPGVQLGTEISVNNISYRVVYVEHNYSLNGEYQNTFKAISSKSQAYPKTDVALFPEAKPQTAIVKDNNDPEGLSRIKVQFRWQAKDSLTTPWIRMLSPHGGGDKGFHFIPEKEEEVLVGFEGGNAERPYYMGSLYNSKAKPAEDWKTKTNAIKVVQTRSGNKIVMNDDDGSITISDKAGSAIVLDGKGNIQLSGAKQVLVTAPDVVSVSSDDTVTVDAKTTTVSGKKAATITSDDTATLSGKKTATVSSDKEATVSGTAKATLSSSGTSALEGTIIKLN